MDEENSAGAVVFHRNNSEILYLILHYEEGHWDFPKGHIEAGETPIDAMLREVFEETGLKVNPIFGFNKQIDYTFRAKYDNGKLKHKTVTFFVAESEITDVKLSFEHIGYEWLPYERALTRITYANSRKVLKSAHTFLKSILQK